MQVPVRVPDQERQRLARLHLLAVLDTQPEPVFDALARIAAAVSGKPIALISLIDEERQWIKANHGLEGTQEIPRDIAFCAHAIGQEGVMEVTDATTDPRFMRNPLVMGAPEIQFYAGAPIVMPGGECVGTLCVIDRKPGRLSPQQIAALRDLAAVAQCILLQRERMGQRNAAEGELRSYNLLLNNVVDSLPCGLSVFDADLRLIAHNRQFRKLQDFPDSLFSGAEVTFESLIRHNAMRGEYGGGDIEGKVHEIVERARTPQAHHFQRLRPNGVALDIRGAPLPAGGFVTTYVDVSSARVAEEALRESEERQKRALDASGLALWDLDLNTGSLYLSENWAEMLGGVRQAVATTSEAMAQLVPDQDQPRIAEALVSMLKGQQGHYEIEHQVRRDDGRLIWIHSEGRVTQRDEAGRAMRATGTNQDITARKESEELLARAAAMTRATLEATADGVIVVSKEREVMLFNRPFAAMWNFPAELENAPHSQVLAHIRSQVLDPQGYTSRVEALYDKPVPESFEVIALGDGRILERHGRSMELDSAVIGWVWSFRDVTARHHAETEIKRAKDTAEAANRAKTEFLDTVSHEIRTPLNGVLGMTRLLMAENLTAQQRKYLELADSSAQSLLMLINDLLDLGKIEAGRIALERISFNLAELLAQLGELYTLRAAEKGLVFSLHVALDVPHQVLGDPGRLRQILNNLLSNALKFTHEGTVALEVGRVIEAAASTLRFVVTDSGIGIPPGVQERLFSRFVQADSSTTREFGGTGLGLAIVKQLCEQMGGGVLLESQEGRGSAFICEIPFDPVDQAALAPSPAPALAAAARAPRPQRILVAEDNPTNQVVVRGMLKLAGYEDVTIAEDGQQALDAVAGARFDIILMDCRMPVMDGYEATSRLRAGGCLLPIVALTANASLSEKERCLRMGMNDYLSKPLEAQRLAQVLDHWTGVKAGLQSVQPEAPVDRTPAQDARKRALDRMSGDEALLELVLNAFRDHTPQIVTQLRADLRDGDAASVHRHLHSLAGSSAMVGAESLSAHARSLEELASAGKLDAIAAALPDLAEKIDTFMAESTGTTEEGSP